MSALKRIGLRVAVICTLLVPVASHGKLYLEGPETWLPGQIIRILLEADADTEIQTFAFGIDPMTGEEIYSRYAGVLELLNNPVETLPDIIKTGIEAGGCGPGDLTCSYFYIPPLTVPAGTLVQWDFRVSEDAKPGSVKFPLDLGAEADADMDFLPEPIEWRFIGAVPESSTWGLMLLGLAAVAIRAFQRRPGYSL